MFILRRFNNMSKSHLYSVPLQLRDQTCELAFSQDASPTFTHLQLSSMQESMPLNTTKLHSP